MNITYTIDTTQTQTYKCTGGYRYDMDYCNTVLLDTVKSQLSSTFLKVLYNSLRVFETLSHKPQAPPPSGTSNKGGVGNFSHFLHFHDIQYTHVTDGQTDRCFVILWKIYYHKIEVTCRSLNWKKHSVDFRVADVKIQDGRYTSRQQRSC